MSDIFREVDEAMQQEKLANVWKEYGSTIILAVIILIVSSAATTYYKKWDANRDSIETARLTEALQTQDPQVAIQNVIKDTRESHKALGLMTAANLNLQQGKKAEAVALFKQVIDNKKSPRNIRDLARILYVQNNEATTKVIHANLDILKPVLANKKSPWVWHARLEAAVMQANDMKNFAKASEYLSEFKDAPYIPATLKQRAEALNHVYALKMQKEQSAAEIAPAANNDAPKEAKK